ncbi:hypothetical protein Tco_1561118 [Tanacetum coccineum]
MYTVGVVSSWEKVLLVKAQGNGKVLNKEELKFLADPGIAKGPVTESVITHNAAYQADDLDAYNSNCDDISTTKAVLMANLSNYGSDVLSEVPISDNTNNDMLNQSVQEMPYSEPSHFVKHLKNEIHSDSNIISYSRCLIESQNAAVQDTNSSAQQDALILSMFEQLSNQVTNCNKVYNDSLIANESLSTKLERYKEREKEKELLTKTFNVLKNESKEKEGKNIDIEIALEKKVKELDNIVCKMGQSAQTVHMLTKPQVFYDNNLKQALGFQNHFYLKKSQQIRPMLYDSNVIVKENNVISITDSEETLMLKEESRSKMLLKQSDPMVLEKKVNTKPINYAELNRLSEDFDQSASSPVKIEAPRELPKKGNGAELQAKDTTIKKLKAHIKRINEASTSESVKNDFDEIETINIELEHRLTRLIAENEHLKQMYKQLYDSIKPSRVHAKEQTESLVNQVNQKFVEISNLNAQLQEKVFVITALKNDLRKLKGKDIVANPAQMSNAVTIALEMYKLEPVILAPKVKNNMEVHEYYLKHTMEQVVILREVFEQAKSRNPLDSASFSACMYVKLNQELLGYVRDTCPYIHKPSEKLVTVTPINKKKTVQFVDTVTSSGNIPKVVQIVLWYLDSGCSKHTTEDRSQLTNFVHKFLGTVKFGNDQVAKIMRYRDYQIGNVTILGDYYVEGLGYNLFSVGQFATQILK